MVGIFCGEVFFRGEVDLRAVSGHADEFDIVTLGDIVGDGVVDPHIEVTGDGFGVGIGTADHFAEVAQCESALF